MKQNKTYLHLGVTLIVSACAVLMFYDTFFQSRVLLDFFDKLMSVLSPVIYGLVFAYLLAPIVDFFDRYIQKGLPKVKSSLVRGLSILVTWICVIALIYLMFSILIPELVDSTKTLADNFESYYKTVYNWVNSLVENQTIFSDDIYSDQLLSALNGYYDKLVKWVTDTVIPQAQVAIVAVTGGIWSVVIFLKNLLIGMMISVYLLARKESFAKQSKKILYAILPETPYRRTLRAVAEADRIFSGFVRGKLLDSLIIGILCFICCSIFKFPYTPIISVFVGVTNIIPIFGPFLGAIPSAFLILLVSPKQCLYFILFIIALQQFDGNILGPKILGKSTGISSFWVIVAIVVGGGFGGVLGMFLGVPVFACIHSAVSFLCESSLRKKGVTDDAMFAPAPLASPDEKKEVTPALIVNTVAEHFHVSVDDIRSNKRNNEIVVPRQIAMYLCNTMTSVGLKKIGSEIGGRDHSTVLHGSKKISDEMKTSDDMRKTIEILQKKISPG